MARLSCGDRGRDWCEASLAVKPGALQERVVKCLAGGEQFVLEIVREKMNLLIRLRGTKAV
jgi:hypothetical protein